MLRQEEEDVHFEEDEEELNRPKKRLCVFCVFSLLHLVVVPTSSFDNLCSFSEPNLMAHPFIFPISTLNRERSFKAEDEDRPTLAWEKLKECVLYLQLLSAARPSPVL